MKGKNNVSTSMSASKTLEKAFKQAMSPETLDWINVILEQFDKLMIECIEGSNGKEFSKKYILAETRGFTLGDTSCMGANVDASIVSVYFGHVIPYMGMNHYPKRNINRILSSKLDDVVAKYIEYRGFKLGISYDNKDKALDGEIILYR